MWVDGNFGCCPSDLVQFVGLEKWLKAFGLLAIFSSSNLHFEMKLWPCNQNMLLYFKCKFD
jgi:hypothetical protein